MFHYNPQELLQGSKVSCFTFCTQNTVIKVVNPCPKEEREKEGKKKEGKKERRKKKEEKKKERKKKEERRKKERRKKERRKERKQTNEVKRKIIRAMSY